MLQLVLPPSILERYVCDTPNSLAISVCFIRISFLLCLSLGPIFIIRSFITSSHELFQIIDKIHYYFLIFVRHAVKYIIKKPASDIIQF